MEFFVQVTEKESPGGKDLKESLLQKKGKRPKSLLIPPPPEAQPGMGGCYRSNLRSPVFLVDHLLRDLFQCSPYTPPPMLSPVREGSGLYFSTLCSSSAKADPNQLLSSVLGEPSLGARPNKAGQAPALLPPPKASFKIKKKKTKNPKARGLYATGVSLPSRLSLIKNQKNPKNVPARLTV